MTRINTNVSSLVAQKSLQRSNQQLQESLSRLSTGLRINVGKDDPAGLIASEALRSDIISVRKAISNNERANQVIATADSALGQVSSLLNDIRGLVSEAANTGALSDDQIAANQLQLDSSLEAIDRISQITSFQGRRLLDGSLDFISTGVDTKIKGLQIDQANFGTLSQIAVGVDVVAQATQGQLTFNAESISGDVVLQIAGGSGSEAFNFAAGSTIEEIAVAVNLVSDALGVSATVNQDVAAADQAGAITLSTFGLNNDITLTAAAAGAVAGDLNVKFTEAAAGGALAITYVAPNATTQGTLDITLATSAYVNADATAIGDGTRSVDLDADIGGTELNGVQINIVDIAAGAASSTYNHTTKQIEVSLTGAGLTATDLLNAINNDAEVSQLFTASAAAGAGNFAGTGLLVGGTDTALANGVDGGAVTSTALAVRNAINAEAGLQDDFTATLAAGNDGTTTVSAFEEFILSGTIAADNRLQFLGGAGSRNVRFVASGNSTALSFDLASEPPSTENASVIVGKGTVADASFKIEAVNAGALFNNTTLDVIDDNSGDFALYDQESNTLTVNLDLTGGATAQSAVDLINNNSFVASFFSASVVDGDGTGNVAVSVATGEPSFSGAEVDPGTLIVNLATDATGAVTTTALDLVNFFDLNAANQALIDAGISASLGEGVAGSGIVAAGELAFGTNGLTVADSAATDITRAANGVNAQVQVTAVQAGAAFDGVQVQFADTATAGSETFVYDSINKVLTIGIQDDTSTATQVAAAFVGSGLEGTFTITAQGTGGDAVTITDSALLAGGTTTTGTTEGAAVLGNLDEGDAISAKVLDFQAVNFGSDAFVSIKALSGTFSTTDTTGATSDRSVGTDVNARINGIQAIGKGLKASLNTSTLDLSFSVDVTVQDGEEFTFNLTGGGARFQLGPDVVSNQQARLGIQSVSTATLGGVSGRLFELRSGGAKALGNDIGGAAKVVEEVITTVTGLRGRLGAFQKTTLQTNIFTLNDTLANLTDAESSIRDADFAAESAQLTRAQILVQSGTAVLGIANSNPQNVLALLR